MAADFTMKIGEGKWLTFTITRNGEILDLSSATLKLGVKESYDDTSYLIEKDTADFDVSQAALGIVAANITATDSAALSAGNYLLELRTIITADTDVDKSDTYILRIERSVID